MSRRGFFFSLPLPLLLQYASRIAEVNESTRPPVTGGGTLRRRTFLGFLVRLLGIIPSSNIYFVMQPCSIAYRPRYLVITFRKYISYILSVLLKLFVVLPTRPCSRVAWFDETNETSRTEQLLGRDRQQK